jgi:hypothetical protein
VLPTSCETATPWRRWAWRAVAAALVLAPIVALGVVSRAADAPPVNYPHGKFRGDCTQCHTPERWTPVRPGARFDHAKTGFALEGAHAAVKCRACHENLDFSQSKRQCASCHEDPHHGENGLDCARCHAARSFIDRSVMTRFHQLTAFPLTGGHAGLDCESCHPPAAQGHLRFAGTRADCAGCHLELARSVRDPDHANFPTDCAQCHSPLGWTATRVDHAKTRFPLTGAHATVACAGCHRDGVYRGTSTECVSCHRTDYDRTTDPNHASASFPTACALCHTPTRWSGATFDHATTSFPLSGAHATAACAGCHGDGIYRGKSAECVSCHRSSYDATTNPAHAAAGFPTTCNTCHTTTTWNGATFDHATTSFPLTGAHATAACAGCHGDGVYRGKSAECVSCHRSSYDATTDPAHAAAGFPTTCNTCHSTTTWSGATFNHDSGNFPIYSGRHAGLWSACTTCHNSPSNYAAFTCFSCHPHDNRAETDSNHRNVSGYQYDSRACYSCHPRGSGG